MSSLFYLNKYLIKYKWYLILGIVFIFISNVFGILMPIVVKNAVNDIVEYAKKLEVLSMEEAITLGLKSAGFYVLYSALKGVFLFYTRQTIIKMSRFIEFDLKNEIYQQYQKLSFNFYKKNSTGDLMNRISEDVTKVRMYLGPGIMYTINLFFLFVMVIFQMIKTNPTLTLYVLIPLPIMSVLIYFVSSTLNKKSNEVQTQQSFITTFVHETVSGIRVIKSHIKEKETLENFEKESEKYKDKSLSLVKTSAAFMPTITLLIGVSTVLTIYIGILQYQQGNIDAGGIAEFVIYVNMLTWPFASVGWVTSVIQRAAASQTRINDFLKEEPEIISTNNDKFSFTDEVTFKNVSLTYENSGVTALKNLNFTIKKGQSIGIIGRTGSGKSSLAYLLMRLLDTTEGEILIDGKPISEINLDDWRKEIGYVPQEHFLFSDSIKNNVIFGLENEEVSEEKLIKATSDADIHESIIGFPNGYDTVLGERGINLSGGQKQRVSIARALIKNPSVLILDDCLSAVDNETEEKILNSLKDNMVDKTSFIISHRISSIKYTDTILVLKDGELVEVGSHEELLSKEGEYFSIFKKQELSEEKIA